jgi:hypothetical protein
VVAKCIAAGLVGGEGASRTASIFSRGGWQVTPFYAAIRLLSGWWTVRSRRTSRPDKSARSDGIFSRADFVFERSRNVYICLNGKLLRTTGTVIDGSTLRYRAQAIAIPARSKCSAAPTCLRDRFLAMFMRTPAMSPVHWPKPRLSNNHAASAKRHMKRIFMLDRLRLRGLSGAKDEGLLTAIAQNLRRLVKFLRRPPPSAALTCPA